MNTFNLVGTLAKQPALDHTDQGRPQITLQVAVNTGMSGENAGETVAVFLQDAQAKTAADTMSKGDFVDISGHLRTFPRRGKDGRIHHNVVLVVEKMKNVQPAIERAIADLEESGEEETE
jgi:single-stranded DNA-binding protein